MKQLAVIFYLVVLIILSGCNDPKYLKTLPVAETDLSAIPDGTYQGSYKLKLPSGYLIANTSADVTVIISNHRYQSLEITGSMNPPVRKSLRPFLDEILKRQKLNVDGISGASYTQKAVQKAIENALTKK